IYRIVAEFDGSISAEHGVGLLKKDFLHYSRSEAEISIKKGIKKLFDPDSILNPGKIF
ncbi:MAG: FAD-binding oxidoreductase, partial [Gammaproteobacteria bacterium]|nr:FAD-binding oxidoreductase [Gammaproteobacteria bacterium]